MSRNKVKSLPAVRLDNVVHVLLFVAGPVAREVQLDFPGVLELLYVPKAHYLTEVFPRHDHDLPHIRVQHALRVPGQRNERFPAVVVLELSESLDVDTLADRVVDVVVCLHVVVVQLEHFLLFVAVQKHLREREKE